MLYNAPPNSLEKTIGAEGNVVPINEHFTTPPKRPGRITPQTARDEKQTPIDKTQQGEGKLRTHHLAPIHGGLLRSQTNALLYKEVRWAKRLQQNVPFFTGEIGGLG